MQNERFPMEYVRCPISGDRLEYTYYGKDRFDNGYGILTSSCYEFPIIADIPVMKVGKAGTRGETVPELVAKIKRGEYETALSSMVAPTVNVQKRAGVKKNIVSRIARKFIRRAPNHESNREIRRNAIDRFFLLNENGSFEEFIRYYFLENGENLQEHYNYFFFRYGTPSHVTALGLLPMLTTTKGPILEIGCGCGHYTRELFNYVDSKNVIGVDEAFRCLYVAKKFLAPQATFICQDLNSSLPFEASTFSAVVGLDTFHYYVQKLNIIREIKRVLADDGVLQLMYTRNAQMPYEFAGFPLTPQGYKSILGTMPCRIIPDRTIIQQYLRQQPISLSRQMSYDELANEPTVSIVASNHQDIFTNHVPLNHYRVTNTVLFLNPLYKPHIVRENEELIFELTRTDTSGTEDYLKLKAYLPERLYVNLNSSKELDIRDGTSRVSEAAIRLILLDLPHNYHRELVRIEVPR